MTETFRLVALIAGAVVAVGAAIPVLRRWTIHSWKSAIQLAKSIRAATELIEAQLVPNSGSTLLDKVNQIPEISEGVQRIEAAIIRHPESRSRSTDEEVPI